MLLFYNKYGILSFCVYFHVKMHVFHSHLNFSLFYIYYGILSFCISYMKGAMKGAIWIIIIIIIFIVSLFVHLKCLYAPFKLYVDLLIN